MTLGPTISRALAILVSAIVLAPAPSRAQEVGGYTGAFLRRAVSAQETGMAGAFVPFNSNSSAVLVGGAALTNLDGSSATFSTWFLPYRQRLDLAGAAFRLPGGTGLGISIARYGITDIPLYDRQERTTGLGNGTDLAVSASGGLRIGPGAIGATLRYLRFDADAVDGSAGYAVDLSGLLEFESAFNERDWLIASLLVANIAGEQSNGHHPAAAAVRLGGAYVYPLEQDRYLATREDPSGIPATSRQRPQAYLMGAVEVRMAQLDSLAPSITFGAEWALAEAPVGLRLGVNTRTGIAAGFMLRWPANVTVDVGATGDGISNNVAATTSITIAIP